MKQNPSTKTIPIEFLKKFKTVGNLKGSNNILYSSAHSNSKANKAIKEASKHPVKTLQKISNKVQTEKKQQFIGIKDLLAENNSSNFLSKSFPDKTGLNINIEMPQGVRLDELNPLEYKFYIFNRRHLAAFSNAFWSTYRQFTLENPHVDFTKVGRQVTSAKVSFSPNGKINQISILEKPSNEKIQLFFQQFIEHINLPNPPAEMLIDGELWVYYTFILD